MISKALEKKLARRIFLSMNMQEDETVAIRSGIHTSTLAEEIALIAMENGIHPTISLASDSYMKSIYDRVPEKYLKKTSKLSMKIVEAIDNQIGIERPKDPRILENVSKTKIAAAIQGGRPVSKKMEKYNVKWAYVGYPTKEMADKLKINYKMFERFIFKGILLDPKFLMRKSQILLKGLKGAGYVHITDEYGTDLKLHMGNRKIMVDDGYISDADIKKKDVGLNLPAGEVFTTPIETRGDGVLISPKRTDVFTGKMIENIKLVFENGRLNMDKTKAEKNEKAMKETLKKCMAIDRKNEKVVRTTNAAELGIGLNPIITDIIGYLLTDEKIGGTIHVALGNNKNKAYGGKSESCLHWDFITNKGVNLDVIYPNGRTRNLIVKGKIVGG